MCFKRYRGVSEFGKNRTASRWHGLSYRKRSFLRSRRVGSQRATDVGATDLT